MNDTLVTGASGRIGRVLVEWMQRRMPEHFVTTSDLPDRDLLSISEPFNEVWHFAIDWTDPDRTVALTRHALDLCRRRFVLASSITVDPHSGYIGSNALTAAKRACEAMADAFAIKRNAHVVALRLGHFGTERGCAPSNIDEVLRVTERGIRYWSYRAMTSSARGQMIIWNAIGDAFDQEYRP